MAFIMHVYATPFNQINLAAQNNSLLESVQGATPKTP